MQDKIKFAIVGCGNIGRRHVAVMDKCDAAQLVAICDTDAQRLAELGETYNVATYDDYEKMLEEADFDIISICTPHALHAPMSNLAARSKKHILVEKPMALDTASANDMIQNAKNEGVNLWVVKQNRYNKPIMLVRDLLDNNRLGKVFMVQTNVMWNRHQRYYNESPWRGFKDKEGGALHTQVSHFLDLMIWLFGDIIEAKSLYSTLNHDIEIEDCGVSALRFDNGALGSLNWTTCVYNANYEGSITIIGELGTVKIGGKYLNKIDYWDVQSTPMPDEDEFNDLPNTYSHYQGTSSNHDKLVDDLVSQIIDDRRGVVEGPEGLKTIEAIEKIYGG